MACESQKCNKKTKRSMNKDVVIYQSSDGLGRMEAIVDASNETIWVRRRRWRSVGVNVSENLTNRLPFIALM